MQISKSKLEGPWEPSLFKDLLLLRPREMTQHDSYACCVHIIVLVMNSQPRAVQVVCRLGIELVVYVLSLQCFGHWWHSHDLICRVFIHLALAMV